MCGLVRPRRRKAPREVPRAPAQSVQLRVSGEPTGNAFKKVGGIDAIVVRKGDEVGAQVAEAGVARARQPSQCAEVIDLERRMAARDLVQPVVVVLVDQQDAEGAVCLVFQRAEKALQLLYAADGGHDQIE